MSRLLNAQGHLAALVVAGVYQGDEWDEVTKAVRGAQHDLSELLEVLDVPA